MFLTSANAHHLVASIFYKPLLFYICLFTDIGALLLAYKHAQDFPTPKQHLLLIVLYLLGYFSDSSLNSKTSQINVLLYS